MSEEAAQPQRTPLFEVLHAKRYQRQSAIRDIEQATGRRLLVYFENVSHPSAGIDQQDVAPFQDLLFDCEKGCDLDLFLQTPGGDIDVAEKLVYMLRQRAKSLRVIVVERAKSAGTLIALAADEIVMSSTSELGPIDPQITVFAADGRPISGPAHSFLDGLEQIKQAAAKELGLNPAYYPLLSHLDPALLDYCKKAIERSKQFAEKWLCKHMLKDDHEAAASIAERLVNDKAYISSHGTVIDAEEASKLGLRVLSLDPDNDLWQRLWRLYLEYDVECRTGTFVKAFESRKVSVLI
jgi:ATP-dependent protease ClpP protease subunit